MASPALVRGDHSRSFPIWPLLLLAIAGELSLGVFALSHCFGPRPEPNYFATAGVLLSLAAIVQFRIVCAVFRHGACAGWLTPSKFLRAVLVSAGLSYGVGLAVGPVAGIELLSAGCFALLGSITLLPLAANSQTVERWRKLVQQQAPRRIGLVVYYTVLMLALAEASLRGYRALDAAAVFTIANANEQAGIAQPCAGVGGSSAGTARPDVLRVAIVDGLPGALPDQSFCPEDLASSDASPSAGLQLFRLNRTSAGDDWRGQLEARHPDLVLAMISLEHGLKPRAAHSGAFDWRSLETAQLVCGLLSAQWLPAAPIVATDQLECDGRRLAICRTPLDDTVKSQWRATFAELDALLAHCTAAHVRVALVVVPDGFQVNRVLCDTLRRRAGYKPADLDLALPQRRLASYAQERRLALVDLLPYLQASHSPVYQQAAGGWNEQGKAVARHAINGWLQSQYSGLTATAQLSRGN